jgi:hypothetical protein
MKSLKKYSWLLFCFAMSLMACVTPKNSNTQTIAYTPDYSSIFPNPERGWHNRRNINQPDKVSSLDFSDVKKNGHTLLHSYIRLDSFKETDSISTEFLDYLQYVLDTIRVQGLKIILRPTHVWSAAPNVHESRILKHIDQVNAVIARNADVVCHIETGYLGKWGEWHSGLYSDLSSKADGDVRYRIIERILNTTPDILPLAMRYPMHIREILDELPTPAGSKPLTQVQKDRIGHHGDCFLYDEHDRGTYLRQNIWFGNQSIEQQKAYTFSMATSIGGNRMVGGETCSSKIDRIDDTQSDMAKAKWTEININFWEEAIKMWKERILPAHGNDPEESEFDRLSRKLGYRIRLIDASISKNIKAGSQFNLSVNLCNDGYAGIIKKRPLYIVFENANNRYNIELENVDVRTWVSGNIQLTQQQIQLPADMQAGKYNVALWLPDYFEQLHSNPSYSIRFANKNVWDEKNGYNLIFSDILVK